MNDSRWVYTPTLAGLYEAQGYPGRAAEIYGKLQAGLKQDESGRDKSAESDQKSRNEETEEPAKLTDLMEQWIDLLRRHHFLETKHNLSP